MRHGDIWRGLDLLAEKCGVSVSGLARLAGLDGTTFNKSKRRSKDGRLRWPSTESISRVLNAIGIDFSDFARLVDGDQALEVPVLDVPPARMSECFDPEGGPVGSQWQQVRMPELTVNRGLYALDVIDDSLAPLYSAGDRLIVSREAEPKPGDRVLVQSESDGLMIGKLRQQTPEGVELSEVAGDHPRYTRVIKDFDWIARILWVSP